MDKDRLQLLFKCTICNGLLVDATSILPCLHTHCRSCIVQYAKHSNACPQCGSYFEPKQEYLRRDYLLQRLVYRLYPQHLHNEQTNQLEFMRKQMAANAFNDINVPLNLNVRLKGYFKDEKEIVMEESNRLYLYCPLQMKINTLRKFLYKRLQLDSTKYKIIIECDNYHSFSDNDTILDCELLTGRNIMSTEPLNFIVNLSQCSNIRNKLRSKSIPRYPLRKRRTLDSLSSNKYVDSKSSTDSTKQTCSSDDFFSRLPSSSTDSSSLLPTESVRSTTNEQINESFESTNSADMHSFNTSCTKNERNFKSNQDSFNKTCEYHRRSKRFSQDTPTRLSSPDTFYKGRQSFLIKTTTEIQTTGGSELCKIDEVDECSTSETKTLPILGKNQQRYNHSRIINVQSLAMSLTFPEAL